MVRHDPNPVSGSKGLKAVLKEYQIVFQAPQNSGAQLLQVVSEMGRFGIELLSEFVQFILMCYPRRPQFFLCLLACVLGLLHPFPQGVKCRRRINRLSL